MGHVEIKNAATTLGKELCGRVPHVVGASVRRGGLGNRDLSLYVDIDTDEISDVKSTLSQIPDFFCVHEKEKRDPAASCYMDV